MKVAWAPIIERAAEIVESYTTAVTLRQLHYRLVSLPELGYPNTEHAYKRLSHLTAKGRRDGTFPALVDLTREITRPSGWDSPGKFLSAVTKVYRRDRTEGQEVVPVVIVEKATLVAQLEEWFSEPLGIAIAPLRGYSSESNDREIEDTFSDGRSYRAIYAGDFDPSGEDIERNAVRYIGDLFDDWQRVCVTPDDIDRFGLTENPGKATDARAAAFVARHGRLVQVEVEALDPDDLRDLIQAEIDTEWDDSALAAVMEREHEERAAIQRFADSFAHEGE